MLERAEGFNEKPKNMWSFSFSERTGEWRDVFADRQVIIITKHDKPLMDAFGYRDDVCALGGRVAQYGCQKWISIGGPYCAGSLQNAAGYCV